MAIEDCPDVTEPSSTQSIRAGATTRAHILDAAIRCLVQEGLVGASMSAIATTGEVSKALLHYHFVDRTQLLSEVLEELATRTIARERVALERAEGSRAIGALWTWVDGELARGELRVLLDLGTSHDAGLRNAAEAVLRRRRSAATRTVQLIFEKLGLRPRIGTALLGAASMTFIDGLVIGRAGGTEDVRSSFDVFWLALLGLVA
ncbi:MAG TPA: TetR family transcriptional regulator [Gemmatimonadaceae bacterium]|jgi:AcrR family transcriptional regulator